MKLAEMIEPHLVRFSLDGNSKEAVIEEIATLMEEKGYLADKKQYLADVYARENETTTGMGMGLAIPHARSIGVKKTCFSLIHLANKLEWDSLDNQPVEYVIMLAVPEGESKEFLALLSSLSMRLIDDQFRNALFAAQNLEEIYAAFVA